MFLSLISKIFIINEVDIIYYNLFGDYMNNRDKIAREFAEAINSDKIFRVKLFGSVARDDVKDSDIDILIVSDYWDEIDSVITDVVGEIVFDYHELISPYIMSVDRFMNAKDYSFLTNVLEDGVVLV